MTKRAEVEKVHQVTMVDHRKPNAGHVVLVLNTPADAADMIEKLVHGLRGFAEYEPGVGYEESGPGPIIVNFSAYVTPLHKVLPATNPTAPAGGRR